MGSGMCVGRFESQRVFVIGKAAPERWASMNCELGLSEPPFATEGGFLTNDAKSAEEGNVFSQIDHDR